MVGGKILNPMLLLLFSVISLVAWPSVAHAATVTVNSTADGAPGACDGSECTLREAIVWANNNPGLDTILVPAGSYSLSFFGTDDFCQVGDLDIRDDLLIVGENALTSSVNGSSADRVFDVQPNTTVTMRKIGVISGDSTHGGGIRNRGDLKLVEMFVGLNEASTGGGIYTEGPLRIDRSSIFSNVASFGGGIAAYGGPLVIVESTISSNTGTGKGGGLGAGGGPFEILIERSLISSNESQDSGGGGAVFVESDGSGFTIAMTIRNSTITGNTTTNSPNPGDLSFNNPILVNFIHSTLTTTGPELIHAGTTPLGSLRFSNSILVGTCVGDLNWWPYASDGGNLESGGNTCGLGTLDLVHLTPGDLDLLPLMGNGGPTSTRGLGAGSVAIGFGLSSSCVDQDQRTLLRDGPCDSGAFEAGATISSAVFADGFENGDTSAW